MIFTAIEKATGRVLYSGSADDPAILEDESTLIILETAHPDGWVDKEGHHVIPTSPGMEYEWKWGTKTWEVNLQILTTQVHSKRLALLNSSDWTDTLSAQRRLSPEVFNLWQEYRQALRDITDQPGYPLDIKWPDPPG